MSFVSAHSPSGQVLAHARWLVGTAGRRPGDQPILDRRLVLGIGFGLIAAVAWSGYSVASRAGVTAGFSAYDLTAIRFIVAGLVMLPLVLRRGLRDLGGVGWWRGMVLAAGAGPIFSGLYTYGLGVTPFSHGPVISPSVVTVGAIGLAALVLRESPGPIRLIGIAIVVIGLAMVAGGEAFFGGSGIFSPYDLLFVGSGLLWAGYTVLLRRWALDPVMATAAVSVVSMVAIGPVYLLTADVTVLFANPGVFAFHALMQGVVAAVVAVLAFNKAVGFLGAGRAGLFPSMVPMLAVLSGIPLLGEWPTGMQVGGILLSTFGLLLASGVLRKPVA